MTILVQPSRVTELSNAGTSNNPFVTGAPLTGTYSTGIGTEVLSAANAYSGTTFDPWTATPNVGGTATWEVDFGANQSPTFVGIAAHNLADIDATVDIQSSSDGVTWGQVGGVDDTPADNQAIGFRFSASANRYWRVRVRNATDDVSIGVIWFGDEIVIEQRIYQGYTPPITPTQVDLNTNVSEGANLLGSVYVERGSTFQAQFSHIDPATLRGATWKAFQNRWNRGAGAFWGWRPTKYGDLFYGWRSQGSAPIAPTNEGPKDYMGFTLQGRLYDDP